MEKVPGKGWPHRSEMRRTQTDTYKAGKNPLVQTLIWGTKDIGKCIFGHARIFQYAIFGLFGDLGVFGDMLEHLGSIFKVSRLLLGYLGP